MNYFPELNTNKNKTEFELDLSNYAKKSGLKLKRALIHRNLLKKMI